MEDESYRNQLIDSAASAYARGVIDQGAFEDLVTRINALPGIMELAGLAANLPAVFDPALPAAASGGVSVPRSAPVWAEIGLNMGNDKKTGDWVRADGYRLRGSMSNFEMDFREYEGISGFRLMLDVDLKMSNLKLIVPDGWVVDCTVDNSASNIKNKGPSAVWGDNLIAITGALSMSNIKVRYK